MDELTSMVVGAAPANLPSLLTLLLALDRRHTPPLLAGCGWLRSWDACPHRRSCALRVGSLSVRQLRAPLCRQRGLEEGAREPALT